MKKIFNLALIKKDVKLLFPYFIGSLVYYYLVLPYTVLSRVDYLSEAMTEFYPLPQMYSKSSVMASVLPVGIFIAIGLALSFASEKSQKTLEDIARMPFTRLQIYVSKVLVSLVFLVVPLLINVSILFLMGSGKTGFYLIVDTPYFMSGILSSILIFLLSYSFFVMISMLFGSSLGAFICGGIFTLVPYGIYALIIANLNLENMSETQHLFENTFSEILLNLTPATHLFTTDYIAKSIVIILVFLVLGYFLFTLYKMERNSEFLTYTWTEPIFKVGVFICSVLFGRMFFYSVLYNFTNRFFNQVIGIVIGGVLGYIIPKVIISKNREA